MADVRVTITELEDGITADTDGVQVTVVEGGGISQAAGDARYVRTVNGTGPDVDGDVAVEGGVVSVNTQTGVVVLDAGDVGALDQATADGLYAPIGAGGAVDSVNGHTGVVVLAASDVGADASGAAATAQAAAASDATTKANAAQAASQPLDSDLTAIAALTTTSFGRALLALADAAAGRTALGLGTAATTAASAYDVAGAAAAAQAASQPLDSDLTAIATLTTTSYGRAFLALADAAAGRTALGLGTAALSASTDFQPIDSDLTAIAALTTTSIGRSLLAGADAAALRTILALGSAALISSTAGGDLSGTLPSPTVAKINGIAVTGTPAVGNVPTATSTSAATWQAPSGGGSSDGKVHWPIDVTPASPDAWDEEFTGTTTTPSLTWLNQDGSTYDEAEGGGTILKTGPGASVNISGLWKAPPAGTTWTVIAKLMLLFPGGANINNAGLFLRNASSGKVATFGARSGQVIRALYFNNPTTFNAQITGDIGYSGVVGTPFYVRIVKNSATSYTVALSQNGRVWKTLCSAVDVAATIGTIDGLGFHTDAEYADIGYITCYWMRKTA